MEPLKTYDYLTTTRERMFDWIRPLGPDEYTRVLPNWRRNLAETLTHVMTSEWYYVRRIRGAEVPPYEEWPIREEASPPFADLEAAWTEQAPRTRAALGEVRDWRADIEYLVIGDDGKALHVTSSAGGLFTQLVLHEVHHRAQALNMLRQLGVATQDLDFNAMTFRRRDALPEHRDLPTRP